MHQGEINKIYYKKNDFYIFSITIKKYQKIVLKGKLSEELGQLVEEGNLVKTSGQITKDKKFENEIIKINSDNIEIEEKINDEDNLEILIGEVKFIIFKDNNYNVFTIETDEENEYTCVSNSPAFIGTELELKGRFEKTRYGLNFNVEQSKELPFSNENSLIRFLSSKFFKGVGEHFASKIVERFGLDTLDILEYYPERLEEVSGIGQTRAKNIYESFQEKMQIKEVIKFAVKYNITENMIFKLYEKYGKELMNLLYQNPYLITELKGIGFKKADEIAKKMGLEKDGNYRINSFLTYYLSFKAEGNTYFKLEKLLKTVKSELEIDDVFANILDAYYNFEEITYHIKEDDEMVAKTFTKDFVLFFEKDLKLLSKIDKEIVVRKKEICLATEKNYQEEVEIYLKFKELNSRFAKNTLSSSEINNLISKQEQSQGFKYAKQQREILKQCLKEKLVVLTGKAGTGKSTVAKGIIDMYEKNNEDVLNLAPTGKAAKRVEELTAKKAYTIHSACFNLNINNYDVIMIDEAGMLSTYVAYMLIKRLNKYQRLVLIGDVAQIPPVQPGNVFRDVINMINTNFITGLYVELNEIKRQDKNSYIAPVCNKIAQGINPGKIDYLDIKSYEKENEEILDCIKKLVRKEIKENNINFNQLQIISPQYRGIVGINAINEMIQKEFNNNEYLIDTQYKKIKKGDKVIQTMNMKEYEIVNGDTLEVLRVEEQEKENQDELLEGEKKTKEIVICKLDNGLETRIIKYPKDKFIKYTSLSYCCSAHKMQGSEYPVIIYVLSTSHFIMLNRNLLYTGLTRGQKRVHLIYQKKAFQIALNREVNQVRNTVLDLVKTYNIKLARLIQCFI